MSTIANATRVHLLGWPATVVWNWAVLGIAFVVNLVIFAGIDEGDDANTFALVSIYIVFMITAVQTVTQMFAFQVGYGASRRAFFLSAVAQLVLLATTFGVALLALSGLERATDGWGIQLDFYYVEGMRAPNPLAQLAVFVVPFVLVGSFGFLSGALSKRWGTNGTVGLIIGLTVLGGALVAWASWTDSWPAVGDWLQDQPTTMLWAGWPLLLCVPVLAGTWAVLRRTTP